MSWGGDGVGESLIKEWKPENALCQNNMNPSSDGQDHSAKASLAQPGRTHGAQCAKVGAGGSFKKDSTDCPLQNDYCTYSCITMF